MVKMGTAAVKMLALMARVSFRAIKKRLKLRVTPVRAAQINWGRSAVLIFKFLKMKGRRIRDASAILVKAKEKTGISRRVSFMMGAVAPQITTARRIRSSDELSFIECLDQAIKTKRKTDSRNISLRKHAN